MSLWSMIVAFLAAATADGIRLIKRRDGSKSVSVSDASVQGDDFDLVGVGLCRTANCTDGTSKATCPIPDEWVSSLTPSSCLSLQECAQACRQNEFCTAFAWAAQPRLNSDGCRDLGKPRCVQYQGRQLTATSTGTWTLHMASHTCYSKKALPQVDFAYWMERLMNSAVPQGGYACGYGHGWCGCSCGHNQGNTTPCHLPPMSPGTEGGHTCGYYGNLYGCAEAHNTLIGCPLTSGHLRSLD